MPKAVNMAIYHIKDTCLCFFIQSWPGLKIPNQSCLLRSPPLTQPRPPWLCRRPCAGPWTPGVGAPPGPGEAPGDGPGGSNKGRQATLDLLSTDLHSVKSLARCAKSITQGSISTVGVVPSLTTCLTCFRSTVSHPTTLQAWMWNKPGHLNIAVKPSHPGWREGKPLLAPPTRIAWLGQSGWWS